MITAISALIGLLPHLFKYWQDYTDKKQEMLIMQLQFEMAKLNITAQLQEVGMNVKATEIATMYSNIKVNIPWIDGLNALIRPAIALIFTGKLFLSIIYPTDIIMVEHEYSIYAAIIAFYFGDVISNRL